MLVKIYGEPPEAPGPLQPRRVHRRAKKRVEGDPDAEHVSTSYVERQNLSMRMHMRRFTRLTNAFSKKFENHIHMVALYTVWYNFVRVHKTLRMSPAMAAGVTVGFGDMADIVEMVEVRRRSLARATYKNSN